MSCITLTPEISKRLSTDLTSNKFEWYTEWLPAAGVDNVKFVVKVKGSTGAQNLVVQPAMQTAIVRTNAPDTPTVIGETTQTGDGETPTPGISISATTASKYFVRFGVAYKANQAGDAQADVYLQTCAEAFGKIVSTESIALVAPDTLTYTRPVTGWLPTMMVSKFKAVIIIQNADANFRCRSAWQFASTSVESPGTWSDSGSWLSSGEQCTGDVTVTPGSNEMWCRVGIQYKSNDGGSPNVKATIVTSVAIRR